MPKIFRVMLADGDKPLIGHDGKMLGVRSSADVGPGQRPDIVADAAGKVRPGVGGMSVSPSLKDLPDHRIPKRLRSKGVPRARGPNTLKVWRMGEGPFTDGPLTPGLSLQLDPLNARHGLVEPDTIVGLEDYRQAIGQTRGEWVVDEVVQ